MVFVFDVISFIESHLKLLESLGFGTVADDRKLCRIRSCHERIVQFWPAE